MVTGPSVRNETDPILALISWRPRRPRNPAPTSDHCSPIAQEATWESQGDRSGGCGVDYVELVLCS